MPFPSLSTQPPPNSTLFSSAIPDPLPGGHTSSRMPYTALIPPACSPSSRCLGGDDHSPPSFRRRSNTLQPISRWRPPYTTLFPAATHARVYEFPARFCTHTCTSVCGHTCSSRCRILRGSNTGIANVEEQAEVEVTKGYTMTQFCDRMIEVFMHEKPQSKDWRKLLVFRDEWKKYKESFFDRCRVRAEAETDIVMKQKLIGLARKVKKIDDEMENHTELLKEIQENPMDMNAVVARRRKDFTGEFFRHLNVLSNTYDGLEDRDAMARLGAKCLSAVRVYDNAVEQLESVDVAQSKFDDILNSPSLEMACENIKSLAKAKELDSSLVLLINRAWAAAKESTTMKNEVKEIMYRIYKETKRSLKDIAPPEIKLLKYLLNITDPEERFSALATAFSPGDEHEGKDADSFYTTPKELHKWVKIMLDAYHLNKEETDLMEARQMSDPLVIQRLFILQETIEDEYMKPREATDDPESKE